MPVAHGDAPESLASLSARPLDLWRPVEEPQGIATEAEPLSLRWLAEHGVEDWNSKQPPANQAPRPDTSDTVGFLPIDRSDAKLVFRAAFQEWLVDERQADRSTHDPLAASSVASGDVQTITPAQLESIAELAHRHLGLGPLPVEAGGNRRVISIELCEHLRPVRTNSTGEDSGDAAAIYEYLVGDPGTARGEQDLYRLLGVDSKVDRQTSAPGSPDNPTSSFWRANAQSAGSVPAVKQADQRDRDATLEPELKPRASVVPTVSTLDKPQSANPYIFTTSHVDINTMKIDRITPSTTASMKSNGGVWRAAVANGKPMDNGVHYVRVKISYKRKPMFVVGVARPGFDPSSGDVPSGPGGDGWGYNPFSGHLSHAGQWQVQRSHPGISSAGCMKTRMCALGCCGRTDGKAWRHSNQTPRRALLEVAAVVRRISACY
jgi:hypothetical protein